MPDNAPPPDELARQVRQHLEALQAEGVEWLPNGPARAPAAAAGRAAPPAADLRRGLVEPAAPPPPSSQDRRRQELEVLRGCVAGCARCPGLAATRTQTVFGVGPLDAELCFVGEAPGAEEDAQGEPFVGAAGQLLNRIIAAMGMKREEVFICNILRCRPPGNRTPLPDEAANCREWLERTLELVRPKFICALGGTAAANLLGVSTPLGKLRGRFHDYRGIPVLVTYHPAFLLPHRSPQKKKDVWEDMKMLLARMGRPVPGR
ncbi:MAG TPA: uracil-DNA glycosylase [Gemmataceae bacterium]|nr:uracil-DNA glycosylase [Gemmataceae bacterium]